MKHLRFLRPKGTASLAVLLFLCFCTAARAQSPAIDSVRRVLASFPNPKEFPQYVPDTTHILAMNELAYLFYYRQPDSSLLLAEQALTLSRQTGFERGEGEANRVIGIYYDLKNDYIKAETFYGDAIKIALKIGNIKGAARAYSNIAGVYQNQGKMEKAVNHYFKAIKIHQDLKNKPGEAIVYTNLGIMYIHQKNYLKAEEYCKKYIEFQKEIGDKADLAGGYSNLGRVYFEQDSLPPALEMFEKGYEMAIQADSKRSASLYLCNIAETRMKMGETKEALAQGQKSLALAEETDNRRVVARANIVLGATHLRAGDAAAALPFLEKGAKLSKDLRLGEEVPLSLDYLYQVYEKTGKHQLALATYKQFRHVQDSILNTDNFKKAMQKDFEHQEGVLKIEEAKKELLRDQERERENMIRYSLFGGLFLVGALLFAAYRAFKIKSNSLKVISLQKAEILQQKEEIQQQADNLQEMNEAVSLKNTELEQQKEEIVAQSENLREANEEIGKQKDVLEEALAKLQNLESFKEDMMGMIVHDLKNPLNSILGFSARRPHDKDMVRVSSSAKLMLGMVMNILDVQKFENAKMQLQLSKLSVFELAHDAFEQVRLLADEKNISLKNQVPDTTFALGDKETLLRMFENLLTNAIKYTPAGGEVGISAENMDGDRLRVAVWDTGMGIPKEKLGLVFERFGQVEARASGKVKSTGLGLTFCKMAAEAHGGEIGVESEVGKGSVFFFSLQGRADGAVAESLAPAQQNAAPHDAETLAEIAGFLPLVSGLQVYHASDMLSRLNEYKKTPRSEAFERWAEDVLKAMYNFDEEGFKRMMNYER